MKHKHYLISLVVMLVFCGALWGQTGAKGLAKMDNDQLNEFAKTSEALSTAGSNYVETIASIFEAGNIQLTGANKEETQHRQSQYNRLVYVIPVLAGKIANKKKYGKKVDAWIHDFSNEFDLSYAQADAIKEQLSVYVKAQSEYLNVYNTLFGGGSKGNKMPSLVPPPPPPPVQQHHTSG